MQHLYLTPSIGEKEQMTGYGIDATKTGHVTIHQRSTRIGQAMDGNTMRWLGAFIFATQRAISTTPTEKKNSKGILH